MTLSLKRGILAQARISQSQQSQNAISRLGETTLAQARILRYSPGFHPPGLKDINSVLNIIVHLPPCLFVSLKQRGSSSAAAGRTDAVRDPNFSPALQATRLASIQRKNNFTYKDGNYLTMVREKIIVLDADLFLFVGGLSSSGAPLVDCENE
ncbi:hypothetical protein Lal_00024165 [Lupinus albus]|nr:hypothetical protein Lal_00024165 [Lupinus albus]